MAFLTLTIWHMRCAYGLKWGHKMNLSSAKVIAILGLSIILTNSGVAWASQRCSGHSESGDHIHLVQIESPLAAGYRRYSSPTIAVEHTHPPPARIHCTESPVLKIWFGPVVPVFRLETPKDNVIHAFLPAEFLNARARALSGRCFLSVHHALQTFLSPNLSIPRLRI